MPLRWETCANAETARTFPRVIVRHIRRTKLKLRHYQELTIILASARQYHRMLIATVKANINEPMAALALNLGGVSLDTTPSKVAKPARSRVHKCNSSSRLTLELYRMRVPSQG